MIRRSSTKSILFLVVFIDLLGFGVMIPMLPFFARAFGANALQVGWLMFVYSFMQIFVSPLWGQLSDRMGRRPILLITILGQCVAFFAAGLSTTYTQLLLSRVFAGIFAANISTANAYMADITPREERAKGMGILGAAFGLGFIFGPAIGGLLISYGVQWPSYFAAILSALNLSWAFFFLGEPRIPEAARAQNRRRIDLSAFREVFSSARLRIPITIFFLVTLAFVQLEVVFGLFLVDRFHFSERMAGILFGGMGIVMAIVQGGFIGKLVKKFGEWGVVSFALPLLMIGLGAIAFSYSIASLFIGLFILAIGYSLNNPCLSALTSKAASPEKQGAVLGVYQSASSLARVLGPPLAGWLYIRHIGGAFVAGFFLVLIAEIIFSTCIKRIRQERN